MGKKKVKNKLKNKHNREINRQNKIKTPTNPVLSPESNKTKSQTYNGPTVALKNSVIIQLMARKISILNKKTKAWIQNETKNVMESIKTNKKRNFFVQQNQFVPSP